MKKTLLLVLLASLGFGCNVIHDVVAGSGNRLKEKRTVANFTSISTEGAYEIVFVAQEPLSLEIEGDDNILPLITTEVSNGVLHIKSHKGFSTRKPIALRISAPNLEGLSANGAGSFEITRLKNEKFELNADGAPSIRVSGETKLLKLDSNGAARIDTQKLRADKAVVDSNGVAKVDVYAVNDLEVTVNGPSRVTYHGDPRVKQTVNGPGSVNRKESVGS